MKETASSAGKSVKTAKKKTAKKKDRTSADKRELRKLKKEHEELKDQYLRVLAEFDNYRKRRDKDFIALRENAHVALIEELLPIIDDFDRSFETIQKKRSYKSFFEGTKLIFTKFKAVLERQGLEALEAREKTFDPELHEAIMQVENNAYDSNTVLEEVQKGYKIKDKVIRHSKVVVSK